ncbi:hypothetical protein SBY92_005456 [Candida maltosa Xu316]|uniref:AB hydrolase-1 domain-containing protein n=1 Tax=Candida maltosa (strain Xu316) TaxID=1245528 RepID=M3JUP3_CANMX|nr:hypothetical protein G210_3154 [Candida maltosa Xu316]
MSEPSKVTYNIGGIATHIFNSDKLVPYVKKFNEANHPVESIPINVVYLVHGRTNDYKSTESAAYTILDQYYKKKTNADDVPLIFITFDIPNHGSRIVNEQNNHSWGKNETHAVDMMSIIEGSIQNVKLIIDYLPGYLNLDYYLSDEFRRVNPGLTIKFNNIVGGFSLGGHVAIRYGIKHPEDVIAIAPVIGSSDLTSLFVTRLKKISNDDKKYFYFNYDELDLSDQEKLNYPEALHKRISKQDQTIFENFPMNKLKLFAAFGGQDTLVPSRFSSVWSESYVTTNDASEIYTDEQAGHEVTPSMLDKFSSWLARTI